MKERSESDKMEEIMLPGFRFHPTDEELVGFYLKRKVQQRPPSVEFIKQLDIYKYDPWDLPKMATTGEKEWYFYCPRDRKYRNSARPNRVTGAGFWKATGTDRPIYSSEGNKCIGLKKSLVFYKGRATKGVKTDWMMHEFRLPSLADSAPPKIFLEKTLPPNDAWAICRIFKKTNSTAQRALSQSRVSQVPETSSSSISELPSMPLTAKTSLNLNVDLLQTSNGAFSSLDFVPYKPPQHSMSNGDLTSLVFTPLDHTSTDSRAVDVTSMLLNMLSSMLGDHYCGRATDGLHFGGGFTGTLPHEMQGNNMMSGGDHESSLFKSLNVGSHGDDQWGGVRSIGFPISMPLPMNVMGDAWKPSLAWDSSCPSEMSTSFCSTKCCT
ncbi:hypothetical protein ES288_D13G088600v1 [Gossypium darwinii]|uniref:NAC domain-containing protein n=1 Tax=Gossypium darwinii TaxID=34276 RepID=A0A5D1ZWL6_GOSDA|nr:hypothetical protein ES288_D13G088600v1 [Gossypium darwinii]